MTNCGVGGDLDAIVAREERLVRAFASRMQKVGASGNAYVHTSAPCATASTRAVAHDDAHREAARRPYDGATRSGVATLSSGGAGETWRGIRCDAMRCGTGERQVIERESSSASDCRYRPRSTFQSPRVSLSTALAASRDSELECERAPALLPRLSLLSRPTVLLSSPFLFLSFISFRLFLCCFPCRHAPEDLSYAVLLARLSGATPSLFIARVDLRRGLWNPSLKSPAYCQRTAGE